MTSSSTPPPPPESEPPGTSTAGSPGDQPSYGNMSAHHWSRTRGERNREAIDYYRERSQAPGVAEGGNARNFFCMECDGVIPWDDFKGDSCPHCGAKIDGSVRRYFNWVEIDRTPQADRTAALIATGIAVLVIAALGAVLALVIL